MDLSDPADVVLSRGTAAVLRVLSAADTTFTVRGLAKLADVSPPTAGKIIRRLSEHGIVLTERTGASLTCRFNAEHLAAEPLRRLVHLRTALIQCLRDEISAWPIRPLHASLFGSAARGDGTVSSDLDVLLVRPGDEPAASTARWEEQLFTTGQKIGRMTGNPVSWFDTTLHDLHRALSGGEPIIAEWRRDSVELVGQPLTVILKKAT